jgi:2-polyprenyl-3-methyl-5-hydroxy-6-metoxy-1,4-benzoquinol methylase
MVEPYISYGIGLDYKAPDIKSDKLEFKSINLSDKLPFDDNSFDFITMLAVMEHLENDEAILAECSRILKPAGGILITVPSWYAQPVLEFLSYRLNIINPKEIRDHKRYYNKSDLITLVNKVNGLRLVKHRYFQWRFNNMIFIQRNPSLVKNASVERGL